MWLGGRETQRHERTPSVVNSDTKIPLSFLSKVTKTVAELSTKILGSAFLHEDCYFGAYQLAKLT